MTVPPPEPTKINKPSKTRIIVLLALGVFLVGGAMITSFLVTSGIGEDIIEVTSEALEPEEYVFYGGEAETREELHPHLQQMYGEADEALALADTGDNILGVQVSMSVTNLGEYTNETTPQDLGEWSSTNTIYFETHEEALAAMKVYAKYYVAQGYSMPAFVGIENGFTNANFTRSNNLKSREPQLSDEGIDILTLTVNEAGINEATGKPSFSLFIMSMTGKMEFSSLPVLAGKLHEGEAEKKVSQVEDSCMSTTKDMIHFDVDPLSAWFEKYGCVHIISPSYDSLEEAKEEIMSEGDEIRKAVDEDRIIDYTPEITGKPRE